MVILAVCVALALGAGEKPDWLVDPSSYHARLVRRSALHEIELSNGLVRRVFRIAPAAATIGFDELVRGRSILRAVRPEAHIDTDRGSFDVGGLVGQPDQAYLRPEWIETLHAGDSPFQLIAAEEGPLVARLEWKRVRHDEGRSWPPPGVALHLRFQGNGAAAGLEVGVHYQIYDGLPLIEKWITLYNASEKPLVLHSFASEILAAVESESVVDPFDGFEPPDLHVESDFAFGGGDVN